MIGRLVATAAAAAMAASPGMAAGLSGFDAIGSIRSGGFVGAYVRLPLGSREHSGDWQAGLRLSSLTERRTDLRGARDVASSDFLDLRLSPENRGLYLAGRPVAGPAARRLQALDTGETIALVAGGIVVTGVIGYAVLVDGLTGEE